MPKNKYYKRLDIIRTLSCLAIFLYHLGLLEGGYLAVCSFFTLSGYLLVISANKNKKFSFKEYYLNKLKKIYIPLLLLVFITVAVISFIPSINWYNLKPEVTSVILGYNNYWQLSASNDYFTRLITSPFIHLWYIAILIQFDIIFPFIYLTIKKITTKGKKYLPIIITSILWVSSYGLFYKYLIDKGIMYAYYCTEARLFSLFFGMMLAYIHINYHPLSFNIIKKLRNNKIIFYTYLLLLLAIFYYINAKSIFMPLAMLATTIITLRLIDYSILFNNNSKYIVDRIIKYISNISYEIYLVQYPVIFLFQNITINHYLKILLIIITTLLISIIINYGLKVFKKNNLPKMIVGIVLLLISLYGVYTYIITKDNTEEMNALKNKLAENKKLAEEKQNEYAKKLQSENEDWQTILANLEDEETNLAEIVKNMSIVGVGDSIMLGAIDSLYDEFPNGYFDAAISRTDWEANDILVNLKNQGLLSDVIVFNLGTNGECPESCKNEIFNTIGNRKIFWVNATKPDYPIFNTNLKILASSHKNIHIIDWISASNNHPEYFVADGIHLTKTGAIAYANTIYDGIYKEYLSELKAKKSKQLEEHAKNELNKISFIGNDILLNIYEQFQASYPNSEFIINNELTYEQLLTELTTKKNNNTLTHNIVLIFDNSLKLSKEEYQSIIELCKEYHIYIVALKQLPNIENENVTIINFYDELTLNKNYLLVDKIHLSDEGINALLSMVNKTINNIDK